MTTEIAVLNRLGVALASDSTVTISGINNSKTFDSADKLFELHCRHPVAIMVNGNLDLFGVPWEILIKDFQVHHDGDKNIKIEEWAALFLNFLESRPYFDEKTEKEYLEYVVYNELSFLKSKASQRLWQDPTNLLTPMTTVIPFLKEEVDLRNKEFDELYEIAYSLAGADQHTMVQSYREFFEEKIKDEMLPVEPDSPLLDSLMLLCGRALCLSIQGDLTTGLIFCGYGRGDLYPSVFSIDVDGYIAGKVKHGAIEEVAKVDDPQFGFAKSFAQDEVIERLLDGVDDNFVYQTTSFLNDSIEKLAESIAADLSSSSSLSESEIKIRCESILETLPKTFLNDIAPDFRDDFRQDFERMIAMMPKMELIEFAEALISIAAIEKKASGDDRSVGGPVDVAFITKHEGFVWIKRKLYFEKDLNPRYFWRKFQQKMEDKK